MKDFYLSKPILKQLQLLLNVNTNKKLCEMFVLKLSEIQRLLCSQKA